MGYSRGPSAYGTGIASWNAVRHAGLQLINECVGKDEFGGRQYVISNVYHHPLMVLFLWGNGAKFEAALNAVMSDPEDFAGKLGVNEGNLNVTSNGTVIDLWRIAVPTGDGTTEEILQL